MSGFGFEGQRGAVHTVAQSGRARTVGKDLTEMSAAARAVHFGARHAVAAVLGRRDGGLIVRCEKARPPGPALELGVGVEQRLAAAGALEGAVALFAIQRTRAARLGGVLAQDAERFRRQ